MYIVCFVTSTLYSFYVYLCSFPVDVQDVTMSNKVVSAAVVLQSVWRGRAVRLRVAACQLAAVRIQTAWRGVVGRRAFLVMKKRKTWAATIIQV